MKIRVQEKNDAARVVIRSEIFPAVLRLRRGIKRRKIHADPGTFAYTNDVVSVGMNATRQTYCGCLFYSAGALARKISRLAEVEFAVTGLTPSHGFIVMTVNSRPGITVGELSNVLQLQPSTVTRLLNKLEMEEYVTRTAAGKYITLRPTAKARRKDGQLRSAWKNLFDAYTSVLGEKMSKDLTVLLVKANERLDETSLSK